MSKANRNTIYLFFILIGTILGSIQPPSSHLPLGGLFSISLLTFGKLFRKQWLLTTSFCLLSLLIGHGYTSLWRQNHPNFHSSETATSFTGRVTTDPDIRATKTFLTINPQLNPSTSSKLLLKADRYPIYQHGDVLEIKGIIVQPEPFNGFNYPLYLERFQIKGIIERPEYIKQLGTSSGNFFISQLYLLKQRITAHINRSIPDPESALLGGILLGAKRAIPETIQDALKVTGTSHIIAISGANITILLNLIIQILPITKRIQQFLLITLIGLFITLLTGASASVLRGALVASLGSYLKLRSRPIKPTSFFLSSMLLLVLTNPLLLTADPGFQLSFAAFGGLMYFGKPLNNLLQRIRFLSSLPSPIQSSLAETAAANLGTLPLSFHLFGQLSLMSLIVNPLILWLLPAITFLGLLLISIGWVPLLTKLIALPLWLFLHLILSTVQLFSLTNFGLLQYQPNWTMTILISIPFYFLLFRYLKPLKILDVQTY